MTAQELLQTDATARQAFEAFYRGKTTRSVEWTIANLTPAQWRLFTRSTAGAKLEQELGCQLGSFLVGAPEPTPVPQEDNCPLPAQAPVQTQASAPTCAPAPVQAGSADASLLQALAQGLKAVGFSPDSALTAEQVSSIARAVVSTALDEAEQAGKLGTRREVITLRTPELPDRDIEGHVPRWFARLVKLHACRIPALLVGPAGSGKTTAAEKLAELVEQPFHRVSIAAGTDEGQLQGWLHPVGDHMRFEYVSSVVSHAYEHGGVVLIDDIDLGDANALGILNAALDNGPWHIPLRHQQPSFTRHPDFYICAAANTWGHGGNRQYAGANQLDERTLSRLRAGQIHCDYDAELETKLYGNHKPLAEESLAFAHRLRTRLRALPGQHRDVSTRDIAARYTMLDQFAVGEAWYGQVADWSEEECQRVHVAVDHDAMSVVME